MQTVPNKCRTCSLFFNEENFCAQLDDNELHALGRHSRTMALKRGASMCERLLESWPIVAVADGVIGVKHVLADGRRSIAAFFTEGDVIDMRRRSNRLRGSLVALTKAEVCQLSPKIFEKIIAANPDAQKIAWESLREQANRAIDHSADLGKKQALEKLASFLFEIHSRRRTGEVPADTVRIPIRRCDLAEYLGLQPETVSRGFRELQDQRVIALRKTSLIEIADIPRLKRIANGAQGTDGTIWRPAAGMSILTV